MLSGSFIVCRWLVCGHQTKLQHRCTAFVLLLLANAIASVLPLSTADSSSLHWWDPDPVGTKLSAAAALAALDLSNIDASGSGSTSTVSSNSLHMHSVNQKAAASGSASSAPLALDDFVIAMPTTHTRLVLVQASRAWRRGIRTFLATDLEEDAALLGQRQQQHNESYGFFPNDGSDLVGRRRRGHYAGDPRAAMTPFLAHRHLGSTFKWLILGDDDTVFYLENLLRLVQQLDLDPKLPHMIADNFWFRKENPSMYASRCLPCTSDIQQPEVMAAAKANAKAKAALSEREKAAADRLMLRAGSRTLTARKSRKFSSSSFNFSLPSNTYLPSRGCPYCTPEHACAGKSAAECTFGEWHGGSGMVISVGLLERFGYDDMLQCILRHPTFSGGDAMLSQCLWEAGFAITDPGTSTRAGLDKEHLLFCPHEPAFEERGLHKPLKTFLERLKEDTCDENCLWHMDNDVSQHIRGRFYKTPAASAAAMWDHVYDFHAAHQYRDMLKQATSDQMFYRKWTL